MKRNRVKVMTGKDASKKRFTRLKAGRDSRETLGNLGCPMVLSVGEGQFS